MDKMSHTLTMLARWREGPTFVPLILRPPADVARC